MAKYRFRDQLHLSEAARKEILDGMDAAAQHEHLQVFESGRNNRAARRYNCRRDHTPLIVQHPGGSHSCLYVPVRNISTGGLAFLHGSFIYQSSRTRVLLTRVDGVREPVDGHVVGVRLVRGSVHEVSIRFDKPIDVSLYLSAAELRGDRPEEPAPLTNVEGSVLYGDTDSGDLKHFQACVRASRVQPTFVNKPGAAIDSVKLGRFDVLMIDLHLLEKDGAEVIHDLRRAGHRGPLVITGDTRAPSKQFADGMAAGATHVMRKPFDAAILLRFLRDRIEESRALIGMSDTSVDSTARLAALANQLGEALEDADDDNVRALCQSVAESALRGGHATLNKSAVSVLRSLSGMNAGDELDEEIRRVIEQCRAIAGDLDRR